jgi:hypothetical protein
MLVKEDWEEMVVEVLVPVLMEVWVVILHSVQALQYTLLRMVEVPVIED